MISNALIRLAETPYRFINACFISILAGVVLYSCLINVQGAYSINCWYYTRYGITCPSCGLSRAFHALFTGSISQACQFHQGVLWIASFFLFQLILRTTGFFIASNTKRLQPIVFTDVLLSLCSLIVCFGKGYGIL
jgi:hypothetical protein